MGVRGNVQNIIKLLSIIVELLKIILLETFHDLFDYLFSCSLLCTVQLEMMIILGDEASEALRKNNYEVALVKLKTITRMLKEW